MDLPKATPAFPFWLDPRRFMPDSEVFQPVAPRQGAPEEEEEARAMFKIYTGQVCAGSPGVSLAGLTDCAAFLRLQAADPPCSPGSPQESLPISMRRVW